MKTLESIREEIWEEMLRLEDKRKDQWVDIRYQTLREVLQKLRHLDQLEYREQLEIAYKDILSRGEFWFDGKWHKVVEKEEPLSDGEVRLIVGFDGGTDSYSLDSVDEAFETLTDYGSKYEVVSKQEEQSSETDSVEEVVADFGRALERLRELWRSLEGEELEE